MIYEPGGCELCRGTGYNGRTTISELLVIDDKLRGLMSRNASEGEIEAAAEGSGMVPLRRDGLLNAREGFTSLEEVLRVSRQVD